MTSTTSSPIESALKGRTSVSSSKSSTPSAHTSAGSA
eukprot:CAMPEP_0183363092 /NCGR_PEP_ID=MMETSP0164_2-20130417/73220_1 /TAXON_ID=221442 /ORGANISM="Coccolithus pelagicus ssp braarudi, Strain PLY182g" /LENGTH=36 /DNA_ID= /DNA_START= /DNA_END= /DNA_ORIENTATION=